MRNLSLHRKKDELELRICIFTQHYWNCAVEMDEDHDADSISVESNSPVQTNDTAVALGRINEPKSFS